MCKAALLFAPIIIGAMAFSLSKTFAQESTDGCKSWGDLAAGVMELRQMGAVMSDVMGMAQGGTAMDAVMIEMIKQAFAEPQFSTDDFKAQAILDFRNRVELECYTD